MGVFPEPRPRLQRRPGDADQVVSYGVYAGRRGYDHISEEIPSELAVAGANAGTAALMGLFPDVEEGW